MAAYLAFGRPELGGLVFLHDRAHIRMQDCNSHLGTRRGGFWALRVGWTDGDLCMERSQVKPGYNGWDGTGWDE